MRQLLNSIAITICLAAAAFAQADAACPTLSITGPAGIVQPGELFKFTGTVGGASLPNNLKYQWTVKGGKITEGQGTLEISVDADWTPGGAMLTAELSVVGLPEVCPIRVSESTGVTFCSLNPTRIDEFGKLATGAVRTKLDKFFAELSNHPSDQGYIIFYGTEKEMAARERLLINGVILRNFDRSRITIIRGGIHENRKVFTKLYRVPPGADNPTP